MMMKRAIILLLATLNCQSPIRAGTIADAAVQRTAPDLVAVRWTDADPVSVYAAARPDAPISQARLVSHADRDGEHVLRDDAGGRTYFLLRDDKSGKIVPVAERALPLEQGSNFRDIGGYPAAHGKTVRWGRIFRSGATPLLSEADRARIGALGLTQMIDLRSSEERVLAPTRIEGVPYTAVGYPMSRIIGAGGMDAETLYRGFPSLLAPQMRLLFRALADGRGPVVYNCSAGQDRTGFATALILSVLGVPRAVILRDYLLSTELRHPQFEMPKIDTVRFADDPVAMFFARYQQAPGREKPGPLFDARHGPYLALALDEVKRRWGSVENYLRAEAGVTARDLAKIRAAYLR